MDRIDNSLIRSTVVHSSNLITCHNVYVNGKGGYDGAVRLVPQGGTGTCDGQAFTIDNATAVTHLMRLQPWKTPLPNSEALPYSPQNPEFGRETATKFQKAGRTYQPRWMEELQRDLTSLPSDYSQLLKPHANAHGAIFNRVSLDLGGSQVERGLSSEGLLDLAQREKRSWPNEQFPERAKVEP
jgi:hypothetical protein